MLINNAGYGSEGPIEEVPMEEVRRQFETNVFGLTMLTKLVLPGMRRQGWGKIVNLSSMGGRMTLPGGGFYHATKYAVEAISDALRFEVQGFGIDVIIIEPGPIKTEFGDTAIARVAALGGPASPYKEFLTVLQRQIRDAYEGPMGRLAADADAVAKVDRDGDHRVAAADALRDHDGGARDDGFAALGRRSRLGRRDADAVPDAERRVSAMGKHA